ncbi:protease [Luteimonas gilva]|uniref:Protease n=1 Tax=Luteimonas gilva TaxID=2572684 RepID=A0A4U5JQI7_9GAMM|nr:S8 family peptidase [Luteimonas gilva]TKR30861.1 protease [Luteimonas gilva]
MNSKPRYLAAGGLTAAVLVALTAYASANSGGRSNLAAVAATSASSTTPAARLIQQRTVPLARTQADTGYQRFIVKYRDGAVASRSALATADRANAALRSAGFATASLSPVRRTGTGADVLRATRRLSVSESAAFLRQLRSDPAVQYAQPDYIKQRYEVIPNDPYFGQLQWDYNNPVGGMNATTAWDTAQGEGVIVAVLDTGYADHSDLNANLVPGYDFIHDEDVAGDGDGRDDDAHDPGDWYGGYASSWHGTHVAGTVAAVTDNGAGLAGVAYKAKVQPVRVLGHGGGYTSDIADAIVWASGGSVDGVPDNATPAEVLNLSLGGDGSCAQDPATQEAIDGAISRGVTVVVAAGNDNQDAAYHSPASCRGVITVGANGIDGAKSWFSNYGATVTLSAPGGNATSGSSPNDRWIWSLGNSGDQGPEGESLIGMIGTSQASPHVAATVALMQSAAVAAGKPALTPAQIKKILRSTAKPFAVTPPVSTPLGAGILDAAAATYAATQDVSDDEAELLSNRVPVTGLTGAAGDELLYMIEVPAGTRSLNLRSYGGTGDVSLYVAYDDVPSTTVYDRKSAKPGNSEAVVYTNPAPGTYYVRVAGVQPFANVSVMGIY